jgi:hypothetical protein
VPGDEGVNYLTLDDFYRAAAQALGADMATVRLPKKSLSLRTPRLGGTRSERRSSGATASSAKPATAKTGV